MVRLLATLIPTLFSSLIFAQPIDGFKISGTTVSASTKEPISGATIMFAKTKGVLTDSLGRFTIYHLTSGQYKLFFSALGYDNQDTTITIQKTSVANLKWIITTDCPEFNANKARQDIKEHKPKLLLRPSIAPVVRVADKNFTKQFGVAYYPFGDSETVREECMIIYNRIVITYLDKTFGDSWRKEVRKDVIGLK